MKKKYIIIGMLMLILGIGGIIYNNVLLFKNPKSVFSTEIFPINEISQIYVDDNENFFIGTNFNNIILCFDSDGSYNYTISIPTKSSNFYFDSNGLLHILDNGPNSNKEYVLNINNKEVLEENTYSSDDFEKLFNNNSKYIFEDNYFKKENCIYYYENDSILIKNIKTGKEKTLNLKGVSKKFYIPENICFLISFLGIGFVVIQVKKWYFY